VAERAPARECGHSDLLEAGICELCDIDWLLANGCVSRTDLIKARREVIQVLKSGASAGGSRG